MLDKQNEQHQNIVEENIKQGKFQIANNFIKDFVITEARQSSSAADDIDISRESNEFIKVFLDLMIYNGYNCKRNKQF